VRDPALHIEREVRSDAVPPKRLDKNRNRRERWELWHERRFIDPRGAMPPFAAPPAEDPTAEDEREPAG